MNLFESLSSLKDSKVQVEHIEQKCSIELYGTLKVKLGIIEAEITYFVRTFKVQGLIQNVVGTNCDYEIQDIKATIGGNKIDDFDKFKKGFEDHGMKSISEMISFDKKELILESMKSNKILKSVYGENVMIYELLSFDELKDLYIKSKDSGLNLSKSIIDKYGIE